MTRVILIMDSTHDTILVFEDPRPPHELVKAINTGRWRPDESAAARAVRSEPAGKGLPAVATRRSARGGPPGYWAVSHDPLPVVTVVPQQPPVALSPRHYDVLFHLADGLPAKEIARRLGISRRTVYLYTAELKERMGARSRAHLVALAVAGGLLSGGAADKSGRNEWHKPPYTE